MKLRFFSFVSGPAIVMAASVVLSTPALASLRHNVDLFFQPGPDAPKHLPAGDLYPKGRRFPFALALLGGGDDAGQLAEWKRLGVVCLDLNGETGKLSVHGEGQGPEGGATVGLPRLPGKEGVLGEIAFAAKDELAKTIAAQVQNRIKNGDVAFWALRPGEIQVKDTREKEYLAAASRAIKLHDPLKRPVWTYLPPEATTGYLSHIAPWVDYLGKALEPDEMAVKESRIWFRWATERAVEAIHETNAEATPVAVVVSPRSAPGDDLKKVAATLRHDLYLSFLAGAKGVIESPSRYPVDAATQKAFQSACMEIARELFGPLQLGDVFLFGEEREDIEVDVVDGPREVKMLYPAGGVGEAMAYPSISQLELAYGKERYLFLVNSALERVVVMVGGMPYAAVRAESLFGAHPAVDVAEGEFEVSLEPLEVKIYRMSRR